MPKQNKFENVDLFASLNAVMKQNKLIYERGEREIPAGRFFNGNPDPQLGKFERFEAVPKKCTECGAFFASTSNSVKYCPDCRKRITRRQAAERMRKRRAPVTQ